MKITLAQINPTIGDMVGNIALMLGAARQAREADAQLVVFPELSLTAYYPGDMLDELDFEKRVQESFTLLAAASREVPELFWVVGAPTQRNGIGKKFYNSLLVYKAGIEVLKYHKQLLPTYGVFSEHRHFEPGPDVARILRVGDKQIGFMVCEDGWNDSGKDYDVNPFQRLADAAPDLIVSINASPSNLGKREQRLAVFTAACKRHNLPLVYVNQVGGHDQLVYDGGSFACDAAGQIVFEAKRFQSDITTLRFDAVQRQFAAADGSALDAVPQDGLSPMEYYRQAIVLGLRDYARRCGFTKAVVGCSGGIDSALTLALAVEAFGPSEVLAITMPSAYSSAGSVSDSAVLCKNLGVLLREHPIAGLVTLYAKEFCFSNGVPLEGLPLENLQARIRGTILMEVSNSFGHLLLTTGNKSEISVGYCTLYGDTNGGLGLIGDLYKTEVFALCRHINETAGREVIPVAIIEKPPSAELAPDQKDTDSLPPYEVLDPLLKVLIEGERIVSWEREEVDRVVGELCDDPAGQALIRRVKGMIARNEYKRRQAPPILRMRGRAFGSGRQMPIAAKHN